MLIQNRLIQIYRSILGDNRKAVYLSTPISTGQRLIDFEAEGLTIKGDLKKYHDTVVLPNKAAAKRLAEQLRNLYPSEVFINPAELGKIDDWTNDNYNDFALEVVRTFAKEVWLLPGWEESVGCKLEKSLAEDLGLPIKYIKDIL